MHRDPVARVEHAAQGTVDADRDLAGVAEHLHGNPFLATEYEAPVEAHVRCDRCEALDPSAQNFGIQEAAIFTDATVEVFPGTPLPRDGSLQPSQVPGLGVDFDEAAAARYPPPEPGAHDRWALLRARDGSAHRP